MEWRTKRIQRRLLAESNLSFKKAMELALSLEAADHNLLDLESQKEGQVNAAVKVVHPPPSRKLPQTSQLGGRRSSSCYRCGGNHRGQPCKWRDATCRFCYKRGHISTVCQSRTRDWHNQPVQSQHQLQSDGQDSKADPPEYTMFNISMIAVLTQ